MKIQKRTDDEFFGTHKGHEININRLSEDGTFYITVEKLSNGLFAYDGWVDGDDGIYDMDQAIAEALRGSELS